MEDGPDEETSERHKWCEEYHPNSHYQPFTTKPFMKIVVIATGVVSPVTLDSIYTIKFRVP